MSLFCLRHGWQSKHIMKHFATQLKNLMCGELFGSSRLAAANERINCALADAVERRPLKDAGKGGRWRRLMCGRSWQHMEQRSGTEANTVSKNVFFFFLKKSGEGRCSRGLQSHHRRASHEIPINITSCSAWFLGFLVKKSDIFWTCVETVFDMSRNVSGLIGIGCSTVAKHPGVPSG